MAGDNCRFSHEVSSPPPPPPPPDHYAFYGPASSVGAQHPPIPRVISSSYDVAEPVQEYDEPYFGGGLSGGPLMTNGGGDSLTVQGPRMELVVSEGEDEDEEDDVVFPRGGISNRNDSTVQDVEKLFASLSHGEAVS